MSFGWREGTYFGGTGGLSSVPVLLGTNIVTMRQAVLDHRPLTLAVDPKICLTVTWYDCAARSWSPPRLMDFAVWRYQLLRHQNPPWAWRETPAHYEPSFVPRRAR